MDNLIGFCLIWSDSGRWRVVTLFTSISHFLSNALWICMKSVLYEACNKEMFQILS